MAIGFAPLWFPFLISWFHTWNRLSFLECFEGERWDDHVTLVCHHHQQQQRINFPQVTAPPLLEWSNMFTSSMESPSPSSEANGTPRITVRLVSPTNADPSSSTATTTTGYGFRRNHHHHHHQNSMSESPQKRWLFPVTTAVVLLVNLGFFVGLWSARVDPSRVALHSTFHHYSHPDPPNDWGTALTGHLSHFEPWHFGFNMMTWLTVGPTLETDDNNSYSTIPLLLWTCSFLPLTSIVVWGIQNLSTRIQQQRNPPTPTISTPTTTLPRPPSSSSSSSMVGFSGILFAWLVIKTLGDGPESMSCPIFFLPNLCFPTYHNRLFHINLGPLVQLIVLQMILPKVSWKGHLAGILVGFIAYHVTDWTSTTSSSLPILDFLQPSVLFPFLWLVGPTYVTRRRTLMITAPSTTRSTIATLSTTASASRRNGGSGVGGGTWGRSKRQSDTTTSNTIVSMVEGTTRRLRMLRNLLIFHVVVCHWGTLVGGHGGLEASSALSSILNLMILQLVIYHGTTTATTTGRPLQEEVPQEQEGRSTGLLVDTTALGVTARAYVGLSYVLMATDGLTVGNWIPTWSLWSNTGSAIAMILARDFLLFGSMASILLTMGTLGRWDACTTWDETATGGRGTNLDGTWWMIIYPVARHSMVVVDSCRQLLLLLQSTGPARYVSLCSQKIQSLFTFVSLTTRTVQERTPSWRKENNGGGNEMGLDRDERLPHSEDGTNEEMIALV